MAIKLKILPSLAAILLCSSTAHSAEIPLTDASHLDLRNTQAEITTYRGQASLRLTETKPGSEQALAILRDSSFHDGTIELDVAGAPLKAAGEGARGFIGIALRMQPDASHYECIYIRPTNGRAEDQLRRNHSTQYMSFPDWPWERLRSESPGVYESYADMVPGEWTHLRIVVHGKEAALYVGKAEQASLLIHDLKLGDSKGAIALWIGPGTDGYFRNLTILDEDRK
jgi:hypothetical protein